jgi:hypothetical protein
MSSPLGQEVLWMGATLLSVAVLAVGLLTATWALTVPAAAAVLIAHHHWTK